MRPIRTVWFLAITIFITFSCDTIEIIDLPVNPPKLALSFIGENGQPWKGHVTLSKGILESPQFSSVNNATVTIYENGQVAETLAFTGDTELFGYSYIGQNIFPIPGNSYRIEVNTETYGTASADYIHPLPVVVDTMEVKLLPVQDTDYYKRAEFKITFTEPAGENYYELFIILTDGFFSSAIIIPEFIDPAYKENKEIFETTIFTDALFDGRKETLGFKYDYLPLQLEDYYSQYRVYLRSLSKEYYLYLKTIHLQKIAAGDPFAQPVYVENNIQNGYGIFGGFTQTVKSFKIEN